MLSHKSKVLLAMMLGSALAFSQIGFAAEGKADDAQAKCQTKAEKRYKKDEKKRQAYMEKCMKKAEKKAAKQ